MRIYVWATQGVIYGIYSFINSVQYTGLTNVRQNHLSDI